MLEKEKWNGEWENGGKRKNCTEEWKLVSLMEGEMSVCDLDMLFGIFIVYFYMQAFIFSVLVSSRQSDRSIHGSEAGIFTKIGFCSSKSIIKLPLRSH